MSGYKFTAAQRFAVYTVHGGVCYLNGEPLYLKQMRIDHVLPRSLKDDPERLSNVLKEYGLPDDFDLDSFGNWLPTCDPCNSLKYKDPFRPTPIIQRHIDRARAKAGETKALAERVVTNQAISKALHILEIALDAAQLEPAALAPLIKLHEQHQRRAQDREFRITPQFTILHEREGYRIVQTNYGAAGHMPSQATAHLSSTCPNCGNYGPWSGARCLSCGHLIEVD
jgi:5-methylcytosine-specific restriction endonuclease McrA